MTIRLFASLCVFFAAATLSFSAWSQQRANHVALLIGNANYPDANTPLPTTIKDARALADELRRDDFDVDLKENVGKDAMQRAIDAFTGKIRSGTVALFYFSGFGIQVARQTYLIPVNAQIWSEDDTKRDGISLDAIVADMNRKGARVKIVIIDASRRNPAERRFRPSATGIAALEAPQNTLVMYSAAPGAVINDGTGDNSLFVSELIKQLRMPNLTAEEVFNHARIGVSRASNNEQIPWVASSLIEDFTFGAPAKVTAAPAPATPSPTRPSAPAPTPPALQAPKPATAEPKPTPPSPARTEAGNMPGDTFRDCPDCSELVVVPAGSLTMGSGAPYEGPLHKVMIAKPFAVGRFEVTFDEWDRCVADKGCSFKPDDRGLGRGNRPVVNISWLDAKEFIAWLSRKTGKTYRLPSESEWEYIARGGTTSVFWWGRDVGQGQANCRECNSGNALQTMPVGSFKPNSFGLYDTAGNAAEWVEDCWNDSYRGAPQDGAPWTAGQCNWRGLRGGSYDSQAKFVASAARFRYDYDVRYPSNGFRVLRELR